MAQELGVTCWHVHGHVLVDARCAQCMGPGHRAGLGAYSPWRGPRNLGETCWQMYIQMPIGAHEGPMAMRQEGLQTLRRPGAGVCRVPGDRRKRACKPYAGLAPEYVEFRETGMVAGEGAHHNLLRPEALEAMFVLWRVTQKPKYRDHAWAMFQAFEKHCKARSGRCEELAY